MSLAGAVLVTDHALCIAFVEFNCVAVRGWTIRLPIKQSIWQMKHPFSMTFS
jgi:hypothetical protein